jgi:hypothetical protein
VGRTLAPEYLDASAMVSVSRGGSTWYLMRRSLYKSDGVQFLKVENPTDGLSEQVLENMIDLTLAVSEARGAYRLTHWFRLGAPARSTLPDHWLLWACRRRQGPRDTYGSTRSLRWRSPDPPLGEFGAARLRRRPPACIK